ncbi:hypothetical protein [Burkholderia multivorans]|uniref:Uncharacterized protein n=1 Tax=Burkholderia multivorans TaxID=87883 RepID=A0A2S9MSW0_9BURK|nr:hypothetical protein [Burkholderia multivorans]MBR7895680.1 hypothetical protein [Burkholderia multivorans]MBU9511789.1 hypothetical protein [Burkholderia multivorans]MBU9539310.1 hypothetical protein [Burkholderia multivorans]MBU9553367.1 hypothetical protein [Burkholderia multivorans]MBU9634884.1 hypothetical protein [Burkholderia multivorans]
MKRDDEDVWEFFNERAAIMEFDAGRRRYDAEYYAIARTRLYFDPRGIGMPATSCFSPFWNTAFGWNDDAGKPVVFPSSATLAHMAVSAYNEARAAGREYSVLPTNTQSGRHITGRFF